MESRNSQNNELLIQIILLPNDIHLFKKNIYWASVLFWNFGIHQEIQQAKIPDLLGLYFNGKAQRTTIKIIKK